MSPMISNFDLEHKRLEAKQKYFYIEWWTICDLLMVLILWLDRSRAPRLDHKRGERFQVPMERALEHYKSR